MKSATKKLARGECLVQFSLTLAALLLISLPFWFTDFDMRVSGLFYNPEGGWLLASTQPWLFLGNFGDKLAFISFISISILMVPMLRKLFSNWQWHLLYLFTALVLGPGVVCNSIFKEHWGRPRPNQVETLGGNSRYHVLWEKGGNRGGYSFPSGHAAAGFSFMVFYPLFRRYRPSLSKAFFWIGIGSGLLLGIGRILQGKHFPSDVLWSAGFVYLTALCCYCLILTVPSRERLANGSARSTIKQRYFDYR